MVWKGYSWGITLKIKIQGSKNTCLSSHTLSTFRHAALCELGPTNELSQRGINRCVLSTLKLTGPSLISLLPQNDRQYCTSSSQNSRFGHSNAGAKSSKQSLPQEQTESLWNPRWQQTTLVQAGLRDAAWQAGVEAQWVRQARRLLRSCRQARSVTLELSAVGSQCDRAS